MKKGLGIGVSVLALMMCAGCAFMSERAEWQNEVVSGNVWDIADGHYVINLEQASGSTDNAVRSGDVYIESGPFLQAYRIEGRKVFNCRWVNCGYSNHVVTPETCKAIGQLPNWLEQNDTLPKPLASSPVVTLTEVSWNAFAPPSPETFTWSRWTARQWVGTPEEVPEEVETLRQNITQAVSAPECVKKYRSYLRAVPLITKESLEAEKDTPLIDLEKTRYHAQCSLAKPYLLIPIPERKSPFPTVRNYTPGDKFKVSYRDGYYYLIETFQGQ